jgi:type II secretory pathway predicted ATPase ExeA
MLSSTFVDEVHHLLAGSAREQRVALNLLKHLSNTLSCCVVALGVYDADLALQSDDQISRRFARIELPRWQESEELRRFLNALEKSLPLRERSTLADRGSVNLILEAGEGITGGMTAFVIKAAAQAIRTGQERISTSLLASILRTDQLVPG